MIRIVLPDETRQAWCPFVQRTASLLQIFERLGLPTKKYKWEEKSELAGDVAKGDIVMYTLVPNGNVLPLLPGTICVEPGVGYERQPTGALRVYESHAWRHHLWGKYGSTFEERKKSWVIPWAFDTDYWKPSEEKRSYVSFLGRIVPDKGLDAIREIAKRLPSILFKIAGVGFVPSRSFFHEGWSDNIEFVGSIYGKERIAFLSKSLVHLCPTEYVEPLNGSAIEAMLCGTPVVSTDWGGFTESVIDGVTGWKGNSVKELTRLVGMAAAIDRSACRQSAVDRFSIETMLPKWERAIKQMVETQE